MSVTVGTLHQAISHRAPARISARVPGAGLVLLLVVLATAAGTALIVAADLADGTAGYETWDVVAFLSVFPALPIMGRMLHRRVPGNPIGALFLAGAAAMALSALAHGYGDFALDAHPGSLPAPTYVVWAGWVGWLGFGALALGVPLLFPDGRLPDLRWRLVAWVGGAAVLAEAVVLALRPGALPDFPAADFPGVENPVGVVALGGVLDTVEDLAAPVFLTAVALGFASLALRYRAGGTRERGQVGWLLCAAATLIAADVLGNLVTGGALHDHPALCTWGAGAARGVCGTVVPMLLYVGFPVAVAVAILRHRLWDIDRLVRRSVLYGGLSLAITAIYVAVAAATGIAAGQRFPLWAAVMGAVATTLAISPVRRRLEGGADRWVFGERKSGYEVLTEFGSGLAETMELHEVAPRLAATVRSGLDLRWAQVRIDSAGGDLRTVALDGTPDSPPARTIRLEHGGEFLGVLECGPPVADDLTLSQADDELLVGLARQACLAISNARLATELAVRLEDIEAKAAELTASRARIVHAAADERRRIERNIHDGAQQEIVGLIAKLRLVRNQLPPEAAAVDATLAGLTEEARTILAGLRELAQGIHPSVLTDSGLVAALEAQADRAAIPVLVEADARTAATRLDPELEGAAYFVAAEAIANAAKHSGAGAILVRLHLDRAGLHLLVRDDGAGFDPDTAARGRGLAHLADRVDAAAGSLRIDSRPDGGCSVEAHFPVVAIEAAR